MKQMIEYIFERHLSLYSDDIVQLVDQLDFSLLYGDKGITKIIELFTSLYALRVCLVMVSN